jgi:hypothetical protein
MLDSLIQNDKTLIALADEASSNLAAFDNQELASNVMAIVTSDKNVTNNYYKNVYGNPIMTQPTRR